MKKITVDDIFQRLFGAEYSNDLNKLSLKEMEKKLENARIMSPWKFEGVEFSDYVCSKYQVFLDDNFKGKYKKYKKAKKKELKMKKTTMIYLESTYGYRGEDFINSKWEQALRSTEGNGFPVLFFEQSIGFDPSEKCE